MNIQRFSIKGCVLGVDDSQLQATLAQIHETPERPRCLCVPGGVEMYVAHHRQFVVKRMPETGSQHHPGCPSYEPEFRQSGLGELVGEAVLESELGSIELRVDFPWTRSSGRGVPRGEPKDVSEVEVSRRRMSLRALMHFLFERAGFNRWTPAMEGRRNQRVLHKYLQEAAESIVVKGVTLTERLYVPEPFSEAEKAAAAQRRREKLVVLRPREGQNPLAVVIGEFKASDVTPLGRRVWIKHMPDAALMVAAKAWDRIERVFAPLFEARDADGGQKVRLMVVALIRARREHTYEIDMASLMLTSEHWIPIEGIHELPLVQALVDQQRRFVKPLRYDARNAASFPNALLLDAGASPVPLHVVSAYLDPKEQSAKALALKSGDDTQWIWRTSESMPELPDRARP
ncbi:DUF1173 family protein [Hydrogenophaga sp.]|uniref:DUF1173 family protein n=1 Tax=Hydrogenophaga sp. TaxID=1904254 RepID=UPI0027342FF4|nr:DUF1173 family protein [Hydrogenophaga sp.]MDP3323419.1 DUF1173 family protein [Hydrogenophaga sp.]MDP3888285.1 DUF1173 family protein [Hydrogenophaga sp.]